MNLKIDDCFDRLSIQWTMSATPSLAFYSLISTNDFYLAYIDRLSWHQSFSIVLLTWYRENTCQIMNLIIWDWHPIYEFDIYSLWIIILSNLTISQNMGIWQGVDMDSLEFHPGPPCPTLLRPASGPPLKRPYDCFSGCSSTGRTACGRLPPLWTPHAVCLGLPKLTYFGASSGIARSTLRFSFRFCLKKKK
jgi:hypothetical protein